MGGGEAGVKGSEKGIESLEQIKYLNLNIFRTQCCKPSIFQTQIIWSNRIHCLKYLRSATFGSKDIVIIKSEYVAKTQFLLGVRNTKKNWNLKENREERGEKWNLLVKTYFYWNNTWPFHWRFQGPIHNNL